ncbi:hypothetical protein OG729_01680 [Streptomyces sp. NBC_00210]
MTLNDIGAPPAPREVPQPTVVIRRYCRRACSVATSSMTRRGTCR